jgi:hypothetical protein
MAAHIRKEVGQREPPRPAMSNDYGRIGPPVEGRDGLAPVMLSRHAGRPCGVPHPQDRW